jgi:trk system potassium uptake protein TrkA
MFVIIAGGGRTGTQLATLLLKQNYQVRLIEHRPEVLARNHRELPTEVVYQGIATNPKVLAGAGIQNAQVLAACTDVDADNLALCYLVRTIYGVPRTIGRINNPRNAWLFNEKFKVDVALNQAEIMARLIGEEMSMGDMMTLLKFRRGQYSLVEEKIPPGAQAVGMMIQDLALPEKSVIAVILRHGEVVIPKGNTVLEEGDEILAVVDPQGTDQLARMFTPPFRPMPKSGLTKPTP